MDFSDCPVGENLRPEDCKDNYRLNVRLFGGFNRLPGKIGAAIVEFITGALAENPHRLSKPLVNELQGMRSARRGDYRVFFTLDAETRTVYIHRIDHRADAYRPR